MQVASRFAPAAMVCSADHLATGAGVAILRRGGSAADAAIAAGAVLTVTGQHMCGLGGDAFALVHRDGAEPAALNASGRAGGGADPDRLRDAGFAEMPQRDDVRAVTVPGCVDGWLALHERYGRLDLQQVLAPATHYAEAGFPASPTLAEVAPNVAALPGGGDFAAATRPGARVTRPGVARTLRAIAAKGRDGFYGGEFGEGLLEVGAGEFVPEDLRTVNADWVEPLSVQVWGQRLWTVPPNSQGYLTLAGAWIAAGLDLPDPADPVWAHLTVESARAAGYDRLAALHEYADGRALLDPELLAERRAAIRRDATASWPVRARAGGTTYLCAVDEERTAVSLIQSNAAGFGSGLVELRTGIFLQNRGVGFNLVPGHPAEYRPGRRPPHTLCPALVTSPGHRLRLVLGTMGGDAQPQILLQLLARILGAGQPVGAAVSAGRWNLADPAGGGGFATWRQGGEVVVQVEGHASPAWVDGLAELGHRVARRPPWSREFGHAHAISCADGWLEGASDPRAVVDAAAGY